MESSFFDVEQGLITASEPDLEEESTPLWLSPEHLVRRTMFRRHVTRLMTGLGMFTLVTLVMHVAAGV